jgi:Fe-S protein assembly co-chaperone HscB
MQNINITCENCKIEFLYLKNAGFICSNCGFLNSINNVAKYNINYFLYLFLNQGLTVNIDVLEQNFLHLMMLYHPDKFVSKSSIEQANSLQHSAYLNECYNCLLSTFKTIEYLYFLQNKEHIINENETSKNNAVVMEFLDLYEQLEDANTLDKKQIILININSQISDFLEQLNSLDFVNQKDTVKLIYIKLTYLYRIKEKIKI